MVRRLFRRLRGSSLATLLELIGFGCLVGAAYLWQPLAGLVVLGVVLIVIANGQAEPER